MVTIFDMVTGEVITDEAPASVVHAHDAASCETRPDALLAPRLQTVEEIHARPVRQALPADLACVSAGAFLASQRG